MANEESELLKILIENVTKEDLLVMVGKLTKENVKLKESQPDKVTKRAYVRKAIQKESFTPKKKPRVIKHFAGTEVETVLRETRNGNKPNRIAKLLDRKTQAIASLLWNIRNGNHTKKMKQAMELTGIYSV